MKKIIFALSTLALLSCSKESVAPLNDETAASIEETTQTRRYLPTERVTYLTPPVSTNLLAGQYMNVGNVDVTYEGNDLIVTYTITDTDWIITDTHLFVGICGQQPVNYGSGNPKVGHFPYKEVHNPGEVIVTYDVTDMPQGCVAAHAVVKNIVEGTEEFPWEETAWADGDPYSDNGDSWATIFGFNFN